VVELLWVDDRAWDRKMKPVIQKSWKVMKACSNDILVTYCDFFFWHGYGLKYVAFDLLYAPTFKKNYSLRPEIYNILNFLRQIMKVEKIRMYHSLICPFFIMPAPKSRRLALLFVFPWPTVNWFLCKSSTKPQGRLAWFFI